MEQALTISGWQLNEVKSKKQKRKLSKKRKKSKDSPLCYSDGHMSSQKFGVRTTNSKEYTMVKVYFFIENKYYFYRHTRFFRTLSLNCLFRRPEC